MLNHALLFVHLDGSRPDSSNPWESPGKNTEWIVLTQGSSQPKGSNLMSLVSLASAGGLFTTVPPGKALMKG